jgi:curved DNA-binding protein CbpA
MSQGIDVNFYDVLGLRRTVTAIQIKAKFRQLALLKHPDKNPENPNATLEFQLVSNFPFAVLPLPSSLEDHHIAGSF